MALPLGGDVKHWTIPQVVEWLTEVGGSCFGAKQQTSDYNNLGFYY